MRIVISASVVVVACSAPSTRPETGVSPPAAVIVDAAPPEVVTGPAPVDAAPPAVDVAPEPPRPPPVTLAPLGELPALYAVLFAPRTRLDYAWKWRVDPHDSRGRMPAWSKFAVTCEVGAVQVFEHHAEVVAKLATVECTTKPAFEEEARDPLVATAWLATADGLRVLGGVHSIEDTDGVRAAVAAGPPSFPARPAPASASQVHDDDDGHYETWTKVTKKGKGWCAEEGTSLFYGHLDRLCFEPRRGLVSWTAEGREGPSEETYTLTRVK